MASQASVQECEAYIEQHGIQAILKECIAKICQERPAKPYKWLREYFVTLAMVSLIINLLAINLTLLPTRKTNLHDHNLWKRNPN